MSNRSFSRSLSLFAVLGAGACVVPPLVTDDTTDDVTTDSGTGDSGVPIKDTSDTLPSGDETGFQDTSVLQDTSNLNLTPLDCHPFDPMSYTLWNRKYAIEFGSGVSGIEVHTPDGQAELQQDVAVGSTSIGYVTKQQIKNAGNNNSTYRQYAVCGGPGNSQAIEIGYTQSVDALAGTKTLRAGAFKDHVYLPNENEMYRAAFPPAWNVEMSYRVKVPAPNIIPVCPQVATVRRDIDAQYVGQGFEQIPVAGLGNVDAFHITLLLDQTQVAVGGNPICDLYGDAFGQVFSELFGYNPETGGYVTAQIDRWYVRGVGLVKEVSVDYSTQALLYSKELTSCKGLPECP